MTVNHSATSTSSNTKQTTAVQVALRVRPLTQQDRSLPKFSTSTEADFIKTYENTVAIVPHQKSFQFDYVFDTISTQAQVFNTVAASLIDKFVEGYNVTILAYGQTSSGKTYTMGTALENQMKSNHEQEGIIPRAMSKLFQQLHDKKNDCKNSTKITLKKAPTVLNRNPSAIATFPPTSGLRMPRKSISSASLKPTTSNSALPRRGSSATATHQQELSNKNNHFSIYVSFVEIYNEELIDLLNSSPTHERPPLTIREDAKGQIIWTGLKEVPVESVEDVLRYLQIGTENRATGSTDMNAKSSRSHAIFSVTLKQEKWVSHSNRKESITKIRSLSSLNSRQNTINVKGVTDKQLSDMDDMEAESGEWITTQSKFHFVDLAGSERLKKTAAQGDRRKEGININAGLLALGNVISALSDPNRKTTHVPYRDSKLTRLLQDSLGGNSTTVMIACVSPSEANLTETINTIKYACRARNIRNKIEKNETEEWMLTDNIDYLRQMINKLKAELKVLKSNNSSSKPLNYNESTHLGIITPSSSSIADTERRPSTCPSASITTANTASDLSTSGELCDSPSQQHQNSNEIEIMVADLRRQIEELQNELIVTRERNQLVERELRQQHKKKKTNSQDFQHLVEPVIEEYEKSITALESQLAMARAALTHSDQALAEQQSKIAEYEAMHANQIQALEELRARLSAAIDREHSSEAYCLELEAQLERAINDGNKDQKSLSELREKIMKFKEMDEHTEQYINDLEARLTAAEMEKLDIQQKLEALNSQQKQYNVSEPLVDCKEGVYSEAIITELEMKCEVAEKQLAQCQSTCDSLREELKSLKQPNASLDHAVQTVTCESDANSSEVAHLRDQVSQKEKQLQSLQEQLSKINALKEELSSLHTTHSNDIGKLEISLAELKVKHKQEMSEEQGRSRKLQESLVALKEAHYGELETIQQELDSLKQQKKELEEALKLSTTFRQQDIDKLSAEVNALQLVEEKQDYIIQGLENKVTEMDNLIVSLRTQLHERDQTIQLLEADNASKTHEAATMQVKYEKFLKDLCGMKDEKNVMKDVMSYVEGTLKQQEAKSEKALITLEDIKHQYKIREEEIEEKRKTLNLLSFEKDELSASLQQVTQQLSQGDERVRSIQAELSQARNSLVEQTDLVARMKQEQTQNKLELQKLHALEARVQELDKEVEQQRKLNKEKQQELAQLEQTLQKQMKQNEELVRTVAELEKTINEERSLVSANDSTGMIAELRQKLSALQQTRKREDEVWRAQMEQTKEELFMSRKENKECRSIVDTLKRSLEEVKHKSLEHEVETTAVSNRNEISSSDVTTSNTGLFNNLTRKQLIEKILQLQEDNNQLVKVNDNLESQMIFQRGQSSLEAKNLELEVMKLTAANDRLEKEMVQLNPRTSNTGPNHFTSPPQTPRVNSPLPSSSANAAGNGSAQCKSYCDGSHLSKLSKSGSYRSVSSTITNDLQNTSEEETMKRLSFLSNKSDTAPSRTTPFIRSSSRSILTTNILPPPTAPPSNPLPPIPTTPLPPTPSAPSSPSLSGLSNPVTDMSGFSSMQANSVGSMSMTSLHRQNSTASASFSDLINAFTTAECTAEEYDKLIRTLQRKVQVAEDDVRAHQEVINKLETQLSRSEFSVREAKKQVETLNKEKQAYTLEVQNLRSQITQIQTEQKTTAEEYLQKHKQLEEKLENQKALKEKAEKARRILENRMDELLNKKNKFMCF